MHADESTPLNKADVEVSTFQAALLSIAIFLKGGLLGAFIPFASLWLSKKGYSPQDLGIVALVDTIFSFSLPVAGATLDKLKAHNAGFIAMLLMLTVFKCAYIPAQDSFTMILVLTAITAPMLRAANSILDALALYSFSDKKHFARVRLAGDIGFGSIAVTVGLSMKFSGNEDAIFVVFACVTLSLAVMWCLCFKYMAGIRPDMGHMSAEEFCKQVRVLAQTAHSLAVLRALVALCVVGGTMGIISTFEFVLLDRMMGSGLLLGLCKLVGTMAAAPVWWWVCPVMDTIGFKNVQLVCLCCAAMRLGILGIIKNPWHALFSEALAGLGGFAASYSTITILLGRVVDESMKGTAQTVVFALFTGIGSGACPLLASYVVEHQGLQPMFTCVSCFVGAVAVCLITFDVLDKFVFGTYKSLEETVSQSSKHPI